jgi:chemotaxis signal transduction protein
VTGGVLFRIAERLYFLPAAIATKVMPMPRLARVPGAPAILVGVALVDGEMVPVVAVGDLDARGSRRPPPDGRARPDNRPMLVCTYLGERIGLVGLQVVATGQVGPQGSGAEVFDVGSVFASLREHRWAV